ncbi:unnamed protein product [Rhizophagus irregularis]|nr:unnamed protein product [Rhizophagus irregularis]CAB4425351.1 unnamed protein product [Rhizophagus irregularis]
MDWFEVEKNLFVPLNSGINENIEELLEIYDDMIIYKAFLLCFRLPVNPLHNKSLSEFVYHNRIINRIIKDIFLDINNAINMMISDHPVEFGEVVGNACNHDDKKMIEKILNNTTWTPQIITDATIYKKDFNFYVMHYIIKIIFAFKHHVIKLHLCI